MNPNIIKEISTNLKIKESQIEATLNLLKDNNTIPFIARYRKEVTGSLDEEQIRQISTYYDYEVNLLKRKEDVIRLIDEKGMLTDELKASILICSKLVEVEDLYRPYKEKKKTKATEAIKLGLEPLSKLILNYSDNQLRFISFNNSTALLSFISPLLLYNTEMRSALSPVAPCRSFSVSHSISLLI